VVKLIRCNSKSPDFLSLTKELDADLSQRNGTVQLSYDKYNKLPDIETVVVAYIGKVGVGCGCFKEYDNQTGEIKRMYVKPENRGNGIAKQILVELEKWARESRYSRLVLETGLKQPEAIGLYRNKGYSGIANYGQYAGMPNSICFGKQLTGKQK
jgi:GNAT superfamily N-acetyltransferase